MSQPRWVRLTHRLLNISQVEEVCVHSTTQAVPLFTFHYLWFHSWQLDVKTWEGCACEFHSPKHLWASGVGERTGWTCKVAGAFLYRWWIVHLIKKIQSVKTYVITFSFLLVLFSYSWAFVTVSEGHREGAGASHLGKGRVHTSWVSSSLHVSIWGLGTLRKDP